MHAAGSLQALCLQFLAATCTLATMPSPYSAPGPPFSSRVSGGAATHWMVAPAALQRCLRRVARPALALLLACEPVGLLQLLLLHDVCFPCNVSGHLPLSLPFT